MELNEEVLLEGAAERMRDILHAYIGEDNLNEGVYDDTPDRFAKAFLECTKGYRYSEEDVKKLLSKSFKVNSSGPVFVKNIHFYSLCEHHLLPFSGHINIGYIPKSNIVTGLSKLARLVQVYAQRIQVQEQLTNQIALAIRNYLDPAAVLVTCEAQHLCMQMRGAHAIDTTTFNYSAYGDTMHLKDLEVVLLIGRR